MIPSYVTLKNSPWGVLPEGIHVATLDEVRDRFTFNAWRQALFDGFVAGAEHLFQAGCERVYLDGSYVTDKDSPSDFDAIWDMEGVDGDLLDPIILQSDKKKMKEKYFGEFFPNVIEQDSNKLFLEFFQGDKEGNKKGIVQVNNWLKD